MEHQWHFCPLTITKEHVWLKRQQVKGVWSLCWAMQKICRRFHQKSWRIEKPPKMTDLSRIILCLAIIKHGSLSLGFLFVWYISYYIISILTLQTLLHSWMDPERKYPSTFVADSCSLSHGTGTYVFGLLDCGECPISWSSYGEVLLLHPTEEMKM